VGKFIENIHCEKIARPQGVKAFMHDFKLILNLGHTLLGSLFVGFLSNSYHKSVSLLVECLKNIKPTQLVVGKVMPQKLFFTSCGQFWTTMIDTSNWAEIF